jgi:hypothetical protein
MIRNIVRLGAVSAHHLERLRAADAALRAALVVREDGVGGTRAAAPCEGRGSRNRQTGNGATVVEPMSIIHRRWRLGEHGIKAPESDDSRFRS